jgi:hypothetical protein
MSRPFNKPMSKQEVMSTIMECAGKLGHTPSQAELMKATAVSQRQIVKQFGTYTRALRACNLERQGGGNKLAMDALFSDWATVVRTLKKIPSKAEFAHLAKHSDTPLKTRFGSWGQVPRCLKRYIEDQGRTEECKDLLEVIERYERGQDERDWGQSPVYEQYKPRTIKNRPLYGPLLRPYPLIHGPINEAGVIYLFGTMAERLGFVVTRIQSEFPDCEAMRLVDEDRWQRVLIEFEYESRNFLKHMHDPGGCDLIVCWKHNWPECPLEVLELRKVIGNQ